MRKIKNFLEKFKLGMLVVVGMGILFDIFVSGLTFDLIILFLAGLWILSLWLYGFEGKISIAGGLIFLTLCPFLLIFSKETIAEKLAIWAYMFLVVGVAQIFIEFLKEKRDAKKER